MKTLKKGEKIVFSSIQRPLTGKPIVAAFSGGQCLTHCPHGEGVMVGSMGCDCCEHNGGKERFGTATGRDRKCGKCDQIRNVYCKKEGV